MILNPIHTQLDKKQPYVWIATWFGCGLMNKAPGTWGSLGAIPPGLLLLFGGGHTNLLLGIIVIIALGFWATEQFSKATNTKDSGMVVIDEVAGMWIMMFIAGLNFWPLVLGFAAFRLFDILKPWPVSYFDRKDGAFGVMMDDVAAGIYAALIIYGARLAGLG